MAFEEKHAEEQNLSTFTDTYQSAHETHGNVTPQASAAGSTGHASLMGSFCTIFRYGICKGYQPNLSIEEFIIM